eukprot:SAG11_NODE_3285_length_2552_cov_5.097432_1_plen_733_part_01
MSDDDFLTESQVPLGERGSINPENLPPAKRSASGTEIAADRLIAELMQDRAESRAARQQQGELLRQNQLIIALQREQLETLRAQAAACAAQAAPIVNVPAPVVNIPAPVVNVQAAAGGTVGAGAAGAATAQPVLPKDVKKLVDIAVTEVTTDLNTANRARASLEGLKALRISDDPTVRLPDGMPKIALQIKVPTISMPKGVEDDDFLCEVNRPLEAAKRGLQITYVTQLVAAREKTLVITGARIDGAAERLTAAITSLLSDTVLSAEHKTELGTVAMQLFRDSKTAAVDKIEAGRKAEVQRKAKAAQDWEEAQLQQLETDNHMTVGALVDAKIAAERYRRRGSEDISSEDVPDPILLAQENAEAEKHFRQASPAANRGGRHNHGKSKQKKQQQQQQNKQKGKGTKGNSKGKGKGASKGASKERRALERAGLEPIPSSPAEIYNVPRAWTQQAMLLLLTAMMPLSCFDTALQNCFVTNLSSFIFSATDHFLLAHGINFVPTRSPPTAKELRTEFNVFSRRIFCHDFFSMNDVPPNANAPPDDRFRIPNPDFHPLNLRGEWEPSPGVMEYVSATLDSVNEAAAEATRRHKDKPIHNLSRRHRDALRALLLRRDIVFADADKNLGLVVLDTSDYANRCRFELAQTHTAPVQPGADFPLTVTRQAIKDELLPLACSLPDWARIWTEKLLVKHPKRRHTYRIPNFRCTIKVHKSPPENRPITGNQCWITQPVAELVAC